MQMGAVAAGAGRSTPNPCSTSPALPKSGRAAPARRAERSSCASATTVPDTVHGISYRGVSRYWYGVPAVVQVRSIDRSTGRPGSPRSSADGSSYAWP